MHGTRCILTYVNMRKHNNFASTSQLCFCMRLVPAVGKICQYRLDKVYFTIGYALLTFPALGLDHTIGNFKVSKTIKQCIHPCCHEVTTIVDILYTGWKAVWCSPGWHPGSWCIQPSLLHFPTGLHGCKFSCWHSVTVEHLFPWNH